MGLSPWDLAARRVGSHPSCVPVPIPQLLRSSCPNLVPAHPYGALTPREGQEPGSKQTLISRRFIFSCLIVRAECTRLCCRMLLLGSWQRLISKCQLLSRGAGSNELQWVVLGPRTRAPLPLLPKARQRRLTRPGQGNGFSFPEMKVKNLWERVCVSV